MLLVILDFGVDANVVRQEGRIVTTLYPVDR